MKLSLSVKIFLVYAAFVALCAYFVTRAVMGEIRPGVRQSTEETLVDTANLLAEILAEPLKNQQLANDEWVQRFKHYGERDFAATIWGVHKTQAAHRIYVTDQQGVVRLDSEQHAVGQDYSQWRDVYLTLRGQYGARTTLADTSDERSTVMHVAAPIKEGDKIIGVVTVARSNLTMLPYIQRSQYRLAIMAGVIVVLGLAAGAGFSWWLSRELRRLRRYALAVSQGQRGQLNPDKIVSHELRYLAQALETMRIQLEGKAYVERYVQTLTHELKSPLAGVRAAAELLQEPLPENKQQQFVAIIKTESERLQHLIDRVLNLAKLEQQQSLNDAEMVNLPRVINVLLDELSVRIRAQAIVVTTEFMAAPDIYADAFLIRQALLNILENALDFMPPCGKLNIVVQHHAPFVSVTIINTGPAIPDYALPRLTERFYSLARPATGKKSTGLGLNFVQEIVHLHGGNLALANVEKGVEVRLNFSTSPK